MASSQMLGQENTLSTYLPWCSNKENSRENSAGKIKIPRNAKSSDQEKAPLADHDIFDEPQSGHLIKTHPSLESRYMI